MATDTAKTAKYAARGSFQILNDPKILIDPINAKLMNQGGPKIWPKSYLWEDSVGKHQTQA